ncbi:MAG: phosphoribosylformylglycinamidine cyclo-ligase [Deltaproteobacteria bacterium]|nr:phosphoribosylformylglycinamidine cyclo-ligase [Deltaproteobacteria bacterium]
MSKSLTYADAGVDIDKGNAFVENIKKIVKETPQKGVLGGIGGFGGLFSPDLSGMTEPVFVSGTDGVGTKLKIAFLTGRHDTIGIDLVAMCVNDIAVTGAKPLFFLDYFSTGKLDLNTATDVVKGIAEGCKQSGCALLGGETAEMPGIYGDNEYDLAGFSVGIVDKSKMIDNSKIKDGHQLIGIESSGIHSNGYSLVRKICFEILGLKVDSFVPELDKTIGEELIVPTKIYTKVIADILKTTEVHGLAHITGGGLDENIVRVLPNELKIRIKKDSWDIPPIFKFLQEGGNVETKEMMRTFNNGIGMVVIVPESATSEVLDTISNSGEKAFLIGDVKDRDDKEERVEWI